MRRTFATVPQRLRPWGSRPFVTSGVMAQRAPRADRSETRSLRIRWVPVVNNNYCLQRHE
jgi:hypothetical protein